MSTKPRKASIGSVSEGTLRSYDLMQAFMDELQYLSNSDRSDSESKLLVDADEWLDSPDHDEELGNEIVQELMEALNLRAPAYCYFGANEGDGASFGFWPCMDAVNELPRVEDGDEAKALGEECVFVNDHGNVTVYNADGSVAWDCV